MRIKVRSQAPPFEKCDWGNFKFHKFPSLGDRIIVYHDQAFEELEVYSFEHQPLEQPIAFPKEPTWRKTSRTTLLTKRCI